MYRNPDIIRINPTFAEHLDGKDGGRKRKLTPVKNRSDFHDVPTKPSKGRTL